MDINNIHRTPQPVQPIESLNVTLSLREARVLVLLTGRSNGSCEEILNMFKKLRDAGITSAVSSVSHFDFNHHPITF